MEDSLMQSNQENNSSEVENASGLKTNEKQTDENGEKDARPNVNARGIKPGMFLAPIMFKFPDLSDLESDNDDSDSDDSGTDDSSECERENEWGHYDSDEESILTRSPSPGSSMDEDDERCNEEDDEDEWCTEEEEELSPSADENKSCDLQPPITPKPESNSEIGVNPMQVTNDQLDFPNVNVRSPKSVCTGESEEAWQGKSLPLRLFAQALFRKKTEVVPVVDERIGEILATTPVIVECILANLPFSTLRKCARVCQLWNTVVKSIKRQRHGIFWMFMLRAVSFWDKHVNRKKYPWQNHFLATTSSEIGDHFYEKLRAACSEPKLCIMFCSNSVADKPLQYFDDYPETCPYTCCQRKGKTRTAEDTCKRLLVDEFLSQKLPTTCSLIGCAGRGLIGTPVDSPKPIRVESSMGLSAVFFPTIPGMEVFQFSVTENEAKKVKLGVDMAKCFLGGDIASQVTGIPQGKKLKCMLVFVQEMDIFRHCQNLLFVSALMRYYMDQQDLKLAFGAGISESIMCPLKPEDGSWHFAVGVAFAGDNVRAASVVLEKNVRKRDEILEKLAELKSCNLTEEECVAFMITSKDRNKNLKGKTNLEAELFGITFPKVPLFGVPVDGEVGINYLPRENEDLKNSSPERELLWLTGCTTVFVLLSWIKKGK